MKIAMTAKRQRCFSNCAKESIPYWKNVLYDYAGLNGETVIPTPEECRKNQPNPFAWNTPIENGAFFNGDLLTGLIDLYEKHPSEKLKTQMRRLLAGLFQLHDLSPVEGCILRGLASDGKTACPASSNDQQTIMHRRQGTAETLR